MHIIPIHFNSLFRFSFVLIFILQYTAICNTCGSAVENKSVTARIVETFFFN